MNTIQNTQRNSDVISFLKAQTRDDYFYYQRRGNGMIEQKKDLLWDEILEQILNLYTFHILNYGWYEFPSSIYSILTNNLSQEMSDEERLHHLKYECFTQDINNYKEALALADTFADSMANGEMIQLVANVFFSNDFDVKDEKVNRLKSLYAYLREDIEYLQSSPALSREQRKVG